MEIVPRIHRIEGVLGERPFCQYLLVQERSLLVDVGVATTPRDVILPYLEAIGLDPAALSLVLLSHADVDHVGGAGAMRAASPGALICAHVADLPWIESHDRLIRERYGWYERHRLGYPPEVWAWIRGALGSPVPVDIAVVGGEALRLGPTLTVEVVVVPGHSPGHVALWEPRSRTAIVVDAVLGRGLRDHAGAIVAPPPYFDAIAYERTIERLRGLAPARLLTAHYPVFEAAAATDFLDESAAFVAETRAAVRDALGDRTVARLDELVAVLDPRLGPFPAMTTELAGPVRAHLDELVAAGEAEPVRGGVGDEWRARR